MTKQEVIEDLCNLCSVVGREAFKHKVAHDCFCGMNPLGVHEGGFQFDTEVYAFIVSAVLEKLKREKSKGVRDENLR